MRQIIAIGGISFQQPPIQPLLENYILAQARKPHPAVCFLPTASGDADGYVLEFYKLYSTLDCQPSFLSLFRLPTADLEGFLLEKDILFVGGGNTRSMLALWREWGLDRMLKKSYNAGVVLAGNSAGANCWFEQCLTDALPGDMQALDCLGYLKGSFCPHYDSEPGRSPTYRKMVGSGLLKEGLAGDDCAALHFVDEQLTHLISSQPGSRAWRLSRSGEGVKEEALECRYLGGEG